MGLILARVVLELLFSAAQHNYSKRCGRSIVLCSLDGAGANGTVPKTNTYYSYAASNL